MKNFKINLFVKLSVIIFFALLIIFSISGIILIRFQWKIMMDEKNRSAEKLTMFISDISANYIYRYSYFNLDENTIKLQNSKKQEQDIVSILIYDKAGKKLNPTGIDKKDIKVNPKYWLIKTAKCIYRDFGGIEEEVGWVEIVYSVEEQTLKMEKIQNSYIVGISLILLLLSIFIFIILTKYIGIPLNDIKNDIHKMSEGNLDVTPPKITKDEIGTLWISFYNMAIQLKESFEKITMQLVEIKKISCEREGLLVEIQNKNEELKVLNEELEERVTQRTNELQDTIKDLHETQGQLIISEKMAALGGLVAGVAHEINTPIGVCLTASTFMESASKEIFKKVEDDQITQDDFDNYIKNCKDISSMISTNLYRAAELVQAFKQVAVDQSTEQKREFNFLKYINEILLSLHSKLKGKNIKLNIECLETLTINSYPGAIYQILTNFINNSVLHGFEEMTEGMIKITVTKSSDKVTLTYQDTGKGIDSEGMKKLYEPFYTTKRGKGGTGLGLSIIYNIVTQKLRGSIKCKSEINKGVEFTIEIPLYE